MSSDICKGPFNNSRHLRFDIFGILPVANPDLELSWGPGFNLLTMLAFSLLSFLLFLTQNKVGPRDPGTPGPSPRCATAYISLGREAITITQAQKRFSKDCYRKGIIDSNVNNFSLSTHISLKLETNNYYKAVEGFFYASRTKLVFFTSLQLSQKSCR